VTEVQPDDTVESVLRRADAAKYRGQASRLEGIPHGGIVFTSSERLSAEETP